MARIAKIEVQVNTAGARKSVDALAAKIKGLEKINASYKGMAANAEKLNKSLAGIAASNKAFVGNAAAMKQMAGNFKQMAAGAALLGTGLKKAQPTLGKYTVALKNLADQQKTFLQQNVGKNLDVRDVARNAPDLANQFAAQNLPDYKDKFTPEKYQKLEKAFQAAGVQVEKLNKQAKVLKSSFRSAIPSLGKVSSVMQGLGNSVSRVTSIFTGFGAVLTGLGLYALISSVTQSIVEIDRLRRVLDGVTSGYRDFGKTLSYVKGVSDKFGLNIQSQVKGFSQLVAATKESNVSFDSAKDIYEGVATAIGGLQLSADDAWGAMRAVVQIMSKGKVQAEELRGQLGERIPGAFQIAAKAMGVTSRQLDEMMRNGELYAEDFLPKFGRAMKKHFADSAEQASRSVGASINRLHNTIFNFLETVGAKGAWRNLTEMFDNLRATLENQQFIENFTTAFKELTRTVAELVDNVFPMLVTLLEKIATVLKFVREHITELKVLFVSILALKFVIFIVELAASFAALVALAGGMAAFGAALATVAVWVAGIAGAALLLWGVYEALKAIIDLKNKGDSKKSPGAGVWFGVDVDKYTKEQRSVTKVLEKEEADRYRIYSDGSHRLTEAKNLSLHEARRLNDIFFRGEAEKRKAAWNQRLRDDKSYIALVTERERRHEAVMQGIRDTAAKDTGNVIDLGRRILIKKYKDFAKQVENMERSTWEDVMEVKKLGAMALKAYDQNIAEKRLEKIKKINDMMNQVMIDGLRRDKLILKAEIEEIKLMYKEMIDEINSNPEFTKKQKTSMIGILGSEQGKDIEAAVQARKKELLDEQNEILKKQRDVMRQIDDAHTSSLNVWSAQKQKMQEINDIVRQFKEDFIEAFPDQLELANEKAKELKASLVKLNDQQTYKQFGEMLTDNIVDPLASAFEGTMKLTDAFREMASSIVRDLGKMALRAGIMKIFGELFKGAGGGGASFLSTVFGIGASSAAASANGNVFTNGSVQQFANGGIVNTPTLFPTRGGIGMMGEGGESEAIMPLARGKNGKLGVRSSGGGNNISLVNNITVDNQAGSSTEDAKQFGKQINRAIEPKIIEILSKQMSPGGLMNQSYGRA